MKVHGSGAFSQLSECWMLSLGKIETATLFDTRIKYLFCSSQMLLCIKMFAPLLYYSCIFYGLSVFATLLQDSFFPRSFNRLNWIISYPEAWWLLKALTSGLWGLNVLRTEPKNWAEPSHFYISNQLLCKSRRYYLTRLEFKFVASCFCLRVFFDFLCFSFLNKGFSLFFFNSECFAVSIMIFF